MLTNGILAMLAEANNVAVNNGILNRTTGGSNIWTPIISMGDSTTNIYNIFGKLYQALNMKSLWVTVGSEVTVPIDSSTSYIFKVTQMPSWTAVGANTQDRIAMRKT